MSARSGSASGNDGCPVRCLARKMVRCRMGSVDRRAKSRWQTNGTAALSVIYPLTCTIRSHSRLAPLPETAEQLVCWIEGSCVDIHVFDSGWRGKRVEPCGVRCDAAGKAGRVSRLLCASEPRYLPRYILSSGQDSCNASRGSELSQSGGYDAQQCISSMGRARDNTLFHC